MAERSVAMIDFMLDTGVRVSEFLGIKMKDVDFDARTAKVLGKGNKERIVYFSDKTLVRLQNYLETRKDLKIGQKYVYIEDAPLFTSVRIPGRELQSNGIRADMKKIGEESGILRLHPHLLRATFATRLAEKGVGIDIIARLLGHGDLRTIDRYVLLSDDTVHQMIKSIS